MRSKQPSAIYSFSMVERSYLESLTSSQTMPRNLVLGRALRLSESKARQGEEEKIWKHIILKVENDIERLIAILNVYVSYEKLLALT